MKVQDDAVNVKQLLKLKSMNKANSKRLTELYINQQSLKYPNFPIDKLGVKKYTDKTANGLTNCIKDFLNFQGHQAERISTMGRVLDNRKTFVDVMGRSRTIGSTQYIPGTGTKGSADLSGIILARSIKIEVKIGKDRQSEAQKQYQKSVESAGGYYFLAKDFDSFIEWYDTLIVEFKTGMTNHL
jgi:hypothetical protein